MAGLDPAISDRTNLRTMQSQFSNHPPVQQPSDGDGGSSPTMTWLDRCAQYVNSNGGWDYFEPAIRLVPHP
jgi:hypothetical protein